MKKIALLIALASTSFSGIAMAGFSADQSPYDVVVSGSCAGTAKFTATTLEASTYSGIYGGDSACGYAMDWMNPIIDAAIPSTSCNVAQFSGPTKGSCGDHSAPTQNSIAAPFLSVSGCKGFDSVGDVQTVSFMLSSGGAECGMKGLATYSLYPYLIRPIAFSCPVKAAVDPGQP
jgi:hypothetical protein